MTRKPRLRFHIPAWPDTPLCAAARIYLQKRNKQTLRAWSRTDFFNAREEDSNDEFHIVGRVCASAQVVEKAAEFAKQFTEKAEIPKKLWQDLIRNSAVLRQDYIGEDKRTKKQKIAKFDEILDLLGWPDDVAHPPEKYGGPGRVAKDRHVKSLRKLVEEDRRINWPDIKASEDNFEWPADEELTEEERFYKSEYCKSFPDSSARLHRELKRLGSPDRPYDTALLRDIKSSRVRINVSLSPDEDSAAGAQTVVGYISFSSFGSIASAVAKGIYLKRQELSKSPEIFQLGKGQSWEIYAVMKLAAAFEGSFGQNVSRLHPSPNGLIAALINAIFDRSDLQGRPEITDERVGRLRRALSTTEKSSHSGIYVAD